MKVHFHLITLAATLGIFTTSVRWWLSALLLFYLIFNHRISRNTRIFMVCACLFFYFYTPYYTDLHATELSSDTTLVTGTIISTPSIDGNLISFRFELPHKEKILIKHLIKTEKEQKELHALSYGDRCTLAGTLEEPEDNRNFYGFNYRSYLKHTYNIHWIYKTNDLSIVNCSQGNGMVTALHRYRQKSVVMLNTKFPDGLAGMMNTLIFGDRSGIDESLEENYQVLGLIHLLAVSGLHVGTILGLIYFMLIRLGVIKEHALVLLLMVIPILILLTGGAPSVIRAGLMAAVVCCISLLRLKISTLTQLCCILLVLLIYKPTFAFHIGFQLSFIITAALIISSKTILREKTAFIQLLYGSVIAQIASLPIVIWNFHEFSLWSLPLNMIFIPLMTIILLPCVFLTYILFVSIPIPLWVLTSHFLTLCFTIIHQVMDWVDEMQIGLITLGRPSSILMLVMISLFYVLLVAWETDYRKMFFSFGCILLTMCFQYYHPKFDENAYITILDVGQGDAIVLELPYRKAVYVIDTGGNFRFEREEWMERRRKFDTGEDIVADFLKARGIRKIDALILSHGDYDHIGGTEGLLNEIDIDKILYGKSDFLEEAEVEFLNQINRKVGFLEEGVFWRAGSSSFQILNPPNLEATRNNRSIVMHAEINNTSFLFTGDVDEVVERRLLKQYPGLEVDFLKIAHHGSKTSTSKPFLEKTDPAAVFISVGKSNRYSHPSKSVIETLEEHGAEIYRTDHHGAIMVIISPQDHRIRTVLPPKNN